MGIEISNSVIVFAIAPHRRQMQQEQQETEIVINRIRKNEWDFENFTH